MTLPGCTSESLTTLNRHTAANGLQIIHIRDINSLEHLRSAWELLCKHQVESNPFYEPWMLMPALREFGSNRSIQFAFVFLPGLNEEGICGFFPFVMEDRFRRQPIRALRLWKHDYCFLCTPLLRQGFERQTVEALIDWLGHAIPKHGVVEFNDLNAGQVLNVIQEGLRKSGWLESSTKSFQRAELRTRSSAQEYLETISNGRRKELRRLRNRLLECGTVSFDGLSREEDLETWMDHFLDLEEAGWKGKSGTAIGQDPASKSFFKSIAREAMSRERLMMLGLFIDGRPIAIKCNILTSDGAYAFKIAYDEEFSRYAPGVQLELENIKHIHDRGIPWMDSCAVPNHPMIDHLWAERKEIRGLLTSPPRLANRLPFDWIRLALWSQRELRISRERKLDAA